MTEYHEDEEFVEVKIPYVSEFNLRLDLSYLGHSRASVPDNYLTLTLASKDGLQIVVHPKEKDGMPHFHVRAKGERPAFSIETDERLKNSKGLERKDSQIRKFWNDGRYKILDGWNKSRPDDRSHQKMKVPDFWPPRDEKKEEQFIITKDQVEDWKK